MALPTRQTAHTPVIQTAFDQGQVYQATLQDGTILWIPKGSDNTDCVQLLAWAEQSIIAGLAAPFALPRSFPA